jgi:hypothetical protein
VIGTTIAHLKIIDPWRACSTRPGSATPRARKYRRFLDCWKDADAGLPELAEARAALAR